jgi:hypothetical protein
MIWKAPRRAVRSWKIFIVAALLFCLGVVGSTYANFTAEDTESTAAFAGGYVASPGAAAVSTATGAVVGAGRTVTWATPTTTGISGFVIRDTNMGTTASPACPSSATNTFPAADTVTAPTGTVVATVPSTDNGYYVCYQVQSFYSTTNTGPPIWVGTTNSAANSTGVRVGLWPTAATKANVGGGGTGTMAANDTLKITYNQAVQVSGSTVSVCVFTDGTLLVGDSCGSSSDTPTVGKLTGLNGIGANQSWPNSTISASASVVTITLVGASTTTDGTTVGTWTDGSGSVVTATGAGNPSPCTASNCTVAATGRF